MSTTTARKPTKAIILNVRCAFCPNRICRAFSLRIHDGQPYHASCLVKKTDAGRSAKHHCKDNATIPPPSVDPDRADRVRLLAYRAAIGVVLFGPGPVPPEGWEIGDKVEGESHG